MTQALPKFSWIFASVLMAGLVWGYIFQVTQSTQAGFLISNYEKKITTLAQESKILENAFPRINSLADLETVLSALSYEKIEKVYYLRVPGTQVVAK